MSTLALYEGPEPRDIRRWILAALVIATLHAGLFAAIVFWRDNQTLPGSAIPPILIDLSPIAATPEKQEQEVAPGPQMQQADTPAEIPEQQKPIEEMIAPTPPQQDPVVALPPEQASKPPSETVKPVAPVRPREVKKPDTKPPAPKTTAAPKVDQRAPAASAAASGAAAAAAAASYRSILAAHLQRFKQYPAASRSAGEQGTATLSFTVSRSGQVLGSRIARSSGHPALDAETLAVLRRAQPLPAFPADIREASMSFNVPMAYALH